MKQNSDNENPSSRKRRAVPRTRSVSGTLRQRESIVPPKYPSDNENPSYRHPRALARTRSNIKNPTETRIFPASKEVQDRPRNHESLSLRRHRDSQPSHTSPAVPTKTSVTMEMHTCRSHRIGNISELAVFNTDSFSERGTGEDLSQRRRNPCIKHLKIRKRLSIN